MADKQEFIELMQARAGMYETLASLYFDMLTDEQIRDMAARDYSALIDSDNPLIASGFNDIWRYLRKRNTGTRQELAVDFSSCFLGTHAYKGLVAQPYESLFLDPSGTLAGKPRKQVHNFYKSERVALREGYDYPDDHLAFECEFMAIECGRCVKAVEDGDFDEAKRLVGVQQEFMNDHIGRWFRRLHDLSLKFIKTRFYRGVLNVTQGFFDDEPEALDFLARRLEEGLEDPAPVQDAAALDAAAQTAETAPDESGSAEPDAASSVAAPAPAQGAGPVAEAGESEARDVA